MNAARMSAAVVAALALALVASGCSNDDHTGTPVASSTTTANGGTTRPGDGSTTTTTTGEPVTATTPTVTSVSTNTLPPVGVGTPAPLDRDIFVTVTKIEPKQLGARGPGEISGPGVVVTVVVRNDTDAPFDLTGLAVNAHYGKQVPAVPTEVPNAALSGFVAPGQQKRGNYTFRIARDTADTVVVDIEHSSTPNVVIVDADPND